MTTDPTTPRPDLTAARDLWSTIRWLCRQAGTDEAHAMAIADVARIEMEKALARAEAEAGVSSELTPSEVREALKASGAHPWWPTTQRLTDALNASLADRSAGSGSRVERVRQEQAAGGGPVTAVMVSRTTEYATGGNTRPTPPPAVDGTWGTADEQMDVMVLSDGERYREAFEAQVSVLARIPADKPKTRAILAESAMWLARKAYRQTLGLPPEPADLPGHTPPTPAPDDRLRALEAALRTLTEGTPWTEDLCCIGCGRRQYRVEAMGEHIEGCAYLAARALLAPDGEGSRS